MEYSFVFLGERNRKKILEEMSSKLSLPTTSFQVVFLTNKKPSAESLSKTFSIINFKTIVFKETATSEQMFETLVHRENLGTVVLFKETATNINFADVNKMVEKNLKGAKVVVSKQIKNENWFSKTLSAIKTFFTKLFLGLKLYPGEGDIILLDTILTATLSEMDGRSALLTKVNGWAGVEPKTVSIAEQTKEKKQSFSLTYFKAPLAWSGLLLLLIVGNILFSVLNVNLPFLALFAYIVVEVAVFGLLIYSLSRSMFNLKYGKVSYVLQSEIVEIIDYLED